MNTIFSTLFAIIFSCSLFAQDINQVYKTKSITFLGLDYSGTVFIGTIGFNDPGLLQILPDSWNNMFMSEPKKYNIQKAFHVYTKYNFNIVRDRNKATDFSKRIIDKSISIPHLSKEDIQTMIDGYPAFDTDGVALVFIVDAYDKINTLAYYHVVFFQMKTKKILLTYTVSGDAGGAGLRNYWANSFYNAILKAGRRYSSTAEFYRDYTN